MVRQTKKCFKVPVRNLDYGDKFQLRSKGKVYVVISIGKVKSQIEAFVNGQGRAIKMPADKLVIALK